MSEFHRLFIVAAAVVAPALCIAGSKPDIEKGKATFNVMCSVCHSVQETGGANQGPNLLGLVGRKAGSQPDFTMYSEALKSSGITWSKKALDKFLVNPGEKVPGTLMPMQIPDDKMRADVVAYLATLKGEKKHAAEQTDANQAAADETAADHPAADQSAADQTAASN
jgi:cytochrome c